MTDITLLLAQLKTGDPESTEKLLQLLYRELRNFAAARLAREKLGQTLQATALVHEVYLRLVNTEQHWDSRGLFFAAAEAMRRILVDKARRKQRPEHGGGRQRVELNEACSLVDDHASGPKQNEYTTRVGVKK